LFVLGVANDFLDRFKRSSGEIAKVVWVYGEQFVKPVPFLFQPMDFFSRCFGWHNSFLILVENRTHGVPLAGTIFRK
jgi:hypothetical protein